MTRVEISSAPDFVILNTCTVTSAADDELRRIVRKLHGENPGTKIVVTGCYAQRAPEELRKLPGVALVAGNIEKLRIGELLAERQAFHGEVYVSDVSAQRDWMQTGEAAVDRSRPNLKIQDGCNNRCSFCIIPSVRGRSRSMPADDAVVAVRQLACSVAEVVLTGINLGRWGRENGSEKLVDLLRRMLDETDIQRIRLSSVEPMDFSDGLLDLMTGSDRIARHVHAPLQSGSDAVLRRMRRRYRTRHYEDRILRARALMPDAAIGADVMTGFPGETEAEFEETRRFVEQLPFTYLHVFPYSERPGTPAAESSGSVRVGLRKERGRILAAAAARKNAEFRASMIGRTLRCATMEGGEAMTSNFLKVLMSRNRAPRRMADIHIGSASPSALEENGALTVLG